MKKKDWMINKSIRFNPAKLKAAKKKKVIDKLPEKCREALDKLIDDAAQNT